jgi:hypothetical protein
MSESLVPIGEKAWFGSTDTDQMAALLEKFDWIHERVLQISFYRG